MDVTSAFGRISESILEKLNGNSQGNATYDID